MRDKIISYIRSGHAGIYLKSAEEVRVEAEIKAVASALQRGLHAWSVTTGMVDTADGRCRPAEEPMEAIAAISELPENTIVLLRDFHAFLDDANPVLVRAVKDALCDAKALGKTIVLLGCRLVLPPELEREFVVLDFALPDSDTLTGVLAGICRSAELDMPAGDALGAVLDSATGMTSTEAENAFALSVVETRAITPGVIAREKALAVKKSGVLEIITVSESLDDIGGLDALKTWLLQRRDAFGEKARAYNLPSPKGVLLLGVPGTGKSLTAKAAASVLQRPLIKLDIGALMGSLVGESEANLRSAIHVAEAVAPCIVYIDELDKALSGSKSSGSSDGGTSSRMFGSLISWMQERKAPVFIIATANDVSQLPAELMRKGRWDEIFWTDLPNTEERRAIWLLKIVQRGRKADDYDLQALATASAGYTGAEIEGVVADSLFECFAESREPETGDLLAALGKTVPLSGLSDQVEALRKWAKGRARPSTLPEAVSKGRRITA